MLTEAALVRRQTVGYFAPTYKLMLPVWEQVRRVLRAPVADEHKAERRIDTTTGGRVEFWSLDNEDAGRSRGYDLIVVDEPGCATSSVKSDVSAVRSLGQKQRENGIQRW